MRIFVSVASYCDTLLMQTLRECHGNADHPDKLVFGVVDQNDRDTRPEIDGLSFRKQIHYVGLAAQDARGPCWARALAQSFYNGEEYFLQIDAHTVFDSGWDTDLRTRLEKMRAYSDRPILSSLPSGFEMREGKVVKTPYQPDTIWLLGPNPQTKMTLENPSYVTGSEHRKGDFIRGHHLAGGFIFTDGAFVEDVPYDPHLYFWGEEQALSLRAFTHGWDVYHVSGTPVYHIYAEKAAGIRESHWNEKQDTKRPHRWWVLRDASHRRLSQLIYGQLTGVYGLGTVRTLEEFRQVSGIDYKRMTFLRDRPAAPLDGYREPGSNRLGVGIGLGSSFQGDLRPLLDDLGIGDDVVVLADSKSGSCPDHTRTFEWLVSEAAGKMSTRYGTLLNLFLDRGVSHILMVHPSSRVRSELREEVRELGPFQYKLEGPHIGVGREIARMWAEDLALRPNDNPIRVLHERTIQKIHSSTLETK